MSAHGLAQDIFGLIAMPSLVLGECQGELDEPAVVKRVAPLDCLMGFHPVDGFLGQGVVTVIHPPVDALLCDARKAGRARAPHEPVLQADGARKTGGDPCGKAARDDAPDGGLQVLRNQRV